MRYCFSLLVRVPLYFLSIFAIPLIIFYRSLNQIFYRLFCYSNYHLSLWYRVSYSLLQPCNTCLLFIITSLFLFNLEISCHWPNIFTVILGKNCFCIKLTTVSISMFHLIRHQPTSIQLAYLVQLGYVHLPDLCPHFPFCNNLIFPLFKMFPLLLKLVF